MDVRLAGGSSLALIEALARAPSFLTRLAPRNAAHLPYFPLTSASLSTSDYLKRYVC
ncbi:hypothetical protein [Paraburkholderia piptadeniae]|uniref:hypothetical protein n=1 Tax=Paraburkholderia piptadeniae TaxID=1701573 RepID=UPI001357651A|nr:hypothetical protein [Paraburkholderia piptadeniae]